VALLVVTGGTAYWYSASTASWVHAWMPNISTGAGTIAITIAVVDRIVRHQRTSEERGRVEQALRRISGDLHALVDFALWDYVDMHPGNTYRRPPNELRALLAHWKAGFATKETPWPADPRVLTASKVLAGRLDEQIQRHERVLEHAFIAASYTYIRSERMSRNMYLDDRDHYDEDSWKNTALGGIAEDITRWLDVFEPYARRYLGSDWRVTLRDDEIDFAELIHRDDTGDAGPRSA
jgi:hypothetical protein